MMSSPTTATTTTTTATSLENQYSLSVFIFLHCLLAISIGICIGLSFTQKRRKTWTEKCYGIPAIVHPLNFLSPTHRYVYAIGFGSFASEVLGLFISENSFDVGNPYANVIIKYLWLAYHVFVLGFVYYPVFACIRSPIRLVGYIIGVVYCILLFAFNIWGLVSSILEVTNHPLPVSENIRTYYICISVAIFLPSALCLLTLFIWYVFKTVKECISIYKMVEVRKVYEDKTESSCKESHVAYVHHLLKTKKPQNWIARLFSPGFDLPFQYHVIVVISVICLFQLGLIQASGIPVILNEYIQMLEAVNSGSNSPLINFIIEILRKLTAVVVVSAIVSTLYCYGVLIHKVISVKQHIKALRMGKDDRFNLKEIKWPSITLGSAVRYTGSQIASIITAWLAYTVLLIILGFVLVVISIDINLIGFYIYFVVISVVMAGLIVVLQIVACKLFFLTHESTWQHTVVINNRRVFNWFVYIALMYNIAAGVVSSVLRVVGAALIGLLAMFRMDTIIYIKAFRRLDLGHHTYLKFLLVLELLNNPVMHVFVALLKKEVQGMRRYNGKLQFRDEKAIVYPRCSKRAFNRWMVAYTLLKNPSLQQLTASKLKESASVSDVPQISSLNYPDNLEETKLP